MNDYREKLYEIRRLNMTFGKEREVDELLNELLNDQNLVLVDLRTLPIKFNKNMHRIEGKLSSYPIEFTDYTAYLHLVTKQADNYNPTFLSEAEKEEFENYILQTLRNNLARYLEESEAENAKDKFEVHKFVNWKQVE